MQTSIPLDLFALGRLPLLPGTQLPPGSTPGVLTFADILQNLVSEAGAPEGTVDTLSAILAEYPVSEDTAAEDLFALHQALSDAVIADGALAGLSLPLQPLLDAFAAVQEVANAIQSTTDEPAVTATLVTQLFEAVVQTVTTEGTNAGQFPAAAATVAQGLALAPDAAPAPPPTDTAVAAAIVAQLVNDTSVSFTPAQQAELESAVAQLVQLARSDLTGREAPARSAAPGTPAPEAVFATLSRTHSPQHPTAPSHAPSPSAAERPLLAALHQVVTANTAAAPAQPVDATVLRDGVTVPGLLTSVVGAGDTPVIDPLPRTHAAPGPLPAHVSRDTATAAAFPATPFVATDAASDGARTVLTTLEERVAVLHSARLALAPLDRDSAPPAPKAEAHGNGFESLLTTFGQVLGSRTASIGAGATAAAAAQATLVDLPDQVVQHVQLLASKDGGIAQLQLQPPALGRLIVHVMQDHDLITVKLHAESQQVREVLQGQMDHLKQQFSDQGLQLVELSILVDAGQQHGASEDREAFAAFRDQSGRANGATRAGPLTAPVEPIGAAPAEAGRLNLIA